MIQPSIIITFRHPEILFECCCLFFFLCSPNTSSLFVSALNNIYDVELSALRDLFYATNGLEWKLNLSAKSGPIWNFSHNETVEQKNPCADDSLGYPSAWQGIHCSSSPLDCYYSVENCTITRVLLDMYNLQGTLPSSIGDLYDLKELSLNNNSLTGSLPSELGQLQQLMRMSMTFNRLNGSLSPALANISSLMYLSLRQNCFASSIPINIGEMKALEYMDFGLNRFEGILPDSLNKLTFLQTLFLSGNQFKGTLSESLSNLSALQRLSLYGNKFIGTVPDSLSKLISLLYLSVAENKLSGTIPESLFDLTALQMLNMSSNQFIGTIPQSLKKLFALRSLDLQLNKLSNSIPEALCDLTNLKLLSLSLNQLNGTIPNNLNKLTDLQFFSVSENKLSGTIPDSLCDLSSLYTLSLSNNQMTGTIPKHLDNLSVLLVLQISDNQFDGTIPSSIYNLKTLQFFHMDHNMLTGTVSEYIGTLTNLQILDLAHNRLVGSITRSLSNLIALILLDLADNQLTGTLPQSLSNLTDLLELNVDGNYLTGSLPSSLDQLVGMDRISLYSNLFSSSLPLGLLSLPYLQELQVHNNKFTGYLTDVFRNINLTSSLLETIDISGNGFRGTLPGFMFKLQRLTNFAASGNCFSGELPNDICQANSIEVLSLSGLSSGSQCPAGGRRIRGTIPSCIFELKNLKAFYISGNRLYGSLNNLMNYSKLINLTATNNHLSGTIPSEYKYSILKLDLSFNRISGTLDDFKTSSDMDLEIVHSALKVNVNRLSGPIPTFINQVGSLDLLSGNLFGCSSSEDLPSNDPNRDNAQCGSSTLNHIMVLSACIICVVGLIFLKLYWYTFHTQNKSFNYKLTFFHNLTSSLRLLPLSEDLNIDNRYSVMQRTLKSTTQLLSTVCIVGISVSICSTVLFVSLKVFGGYGTHVHQYSWIMSAVMTSGEVPAVCLCLLWSTVALCVFYRLIIKQFKIDRMVAFLNFEESCGLPFKGLESLEFVTRVHIVIMISCTVVVNGGYVYLILNNSSHSVVVFVQVLLAGFGIA